MRIAVLLTVYNRIEKTRLCLNRLKLAESDTSRIDVYVVDGGSTDGTQEMLKMNFPNVFYEVHEGVYWNQGMLRAWQWASQQNYNFYLWINDDVELSENWLKQLLELYSNVNSKSIIVGKISDKTTGGKIYGALYRKSGISKLNFSTISRFKINFETFNGNCVLIPDIVFRELGFLNSAYSHSFGDIDYGLRATEKGIPIWETKMAVGISTKSRTLYSGDFPDDTTLKQIFSSKGVPLKEWLIFCKKFGGLLWPVNFVLRYVKLLSKVLIRKKKLNEICDSVIR